MGINMEFVIEGENKKIRLYLERDGCEIDLRVMPVGGNKDNDSQLLMTFIHGKFYRSGGVTLSGIEIDSNGQIMESYI